MLARLLKPGARNVVPRDLIIEATAQIRSLIERLQPYFPPSRAEKRRAKDHPVSAQITRLTTSDSQRRKFFNLAYFQDFLEALPEKKGLAAVGVPRTLAAAREAVILYYFRAGRADDRRSLTRLLNKLEDDYNNSEQAKAHNRRRELYRELMRLPTAEDAAARLLEEFPKEKDLEEFARALKLDLPARRGRRKTAAKRTLHQQLAEIIHARGSIARLDLV